MRKPTDFEEKVYEVCSRIPKGMVSTYSAIAHEMGKRCYRAVGQALNKNPYFPRVPCHRVVMNDGRIGGFGFGGEREKIKRLKAEQIQVKNNRIVEFNNKLCKSL